MPSTSSRSRPTSTAKPCLTPHRSVTHFSVLAFVHAYVCVCVHIAEIPTHLHCKDVSDTTQVSHSFVCACMHVSVHACVCACMCLCMCACMCPTHLHCKAMMQVCDSFVQACMCPCMHVSVHVFVRVCVHVSMHACVWVRAYVA